MIAPRHKPAPGTTKRDLRHVIWRRPNQTRGSSVILAESRPVPTRPGRTDHGTGGSDRRHQEGTRMSRKLTRTLIGSLALLAALVAGCSSPHSPAHHHKATHSSAPSGGGGGNGGIPQNNAGDHDADNNGGPSDGDGNV